MHAQRTEVHKSELHEYTSMGDSDSDAKSTSSSDGESADLKSADIKLQQMRRGARKKRGHGNKLDV